MYDGGLQDPELREYHKEVKFSINLFLPDILSGPFSSFFKVVSHGDYLTVYPLFYCDEILSDDDGAVVVGSYLISVPVGFTGLLTFLGDDGQVVESRMKYVSEDSEGYVTVMIFNAKTREFLPNQDYMVEYPNNPIQKLSTGDNGYGGFIKLEDDYNVVVL